jgi:cytidine deaminase
MSLSSDELNHMYQLAQQMLVKAYSPYSNFCVGACIKSGEHYYSGCNIENVSYSLTSCAEATAISHMIAAGDQHIDAVVVVSSGALMCAPCGACRQRLAEFSQPKTLVYMYDGEGNHTLQYLEQLLPLSFNAKNLAHN